MNTLYRLVDINLNRAAEGLRILEDGCRYEEGLVDAALSFKKIRQGLRQLAEPMMPQLLDSRRAYSDPGPRLSAEMMKDPSSSPRDPLTVNALRVQEAIRALEEYLKALGEPLMAMTCEKMRFELYTLQQICGQKSLQGIRRGKLATDLYGITAECWSEGRSNGETVGAMLQGGIRIIQYREKDKTMLEKYRECTELRKMTADVGALFIVNDHGDLAVAVEADGVHIGQDDIPPDRVRAVIGSDRILGISTHSPAQAHKAVQDGADYIGVGPLYSTQTKVDVCAPVGLAYLEYVVQNITIPTVAIGGIKRHNLSQVVEKGATCVALVTEIVGAADPVACIQELRTIIQGGKTTCQNS